jgi:hypothetical protein
VLCSRSRVLHRILKEVAVEEESWGPIQGRKFEGGRRVSCRSRLERVKPVRRSCSPFLRSVPCRHSCSYISRQRALQLSPPNLSTPLSALRAQQEPKPHAPLLDHLKPFSSTFLVSSAMTLSRIHLPSINSVLTSNRVFLPGHSVVTKLDMEAQKPILLPVPDRLMVCPAVVISVDLLITQIPTDNYSFGRSSALWRPSLLVRNWA